MFDSVLNVAMCVSHTETLNALLNKVLYVICFHDSATKMWNIITDNIS